MELSYKRNAKIISRKFYQYLIPTVLMLLAMQLGSLADSIIVGNLLGEDFLTATSLGLPVVFFVEIPAMMIATGAAIVGANYIGKRMIKEASQVFKLACFLAVVVSLVFTPIAIFAGNSIGALFAGEFPQYAPYITQYIQVYAYQAPVIALAIVVAYFLPSDNSPTLGALVIIAGNVVHLAAEVLFSLFVDKSIVMYFVAGSMGIGMLAGCLMLVPYGFSKHRTIDLRIRFRGSFKFTWELIRAGSSAGALTALTCLYCVVLNLAATSYLSEAEVPVYAMLANFSFVVDLFVLGILQIMPSVVSALYGEKDYFSVRAVCRKVFVIAMAVTAVLVAISLAFPQLFFYIFGIGINPVEGVLDPLLVVRVYAISFAFYVVNKYLVTYYPSILVNSPALFSNVIRIGLIGPLSIYLLMMHTGVIGNAYGVIIMEVATLLLTIGFVFLGKKLKRLSGAGLLLLPKQDASGAYLDISIPAKEEEISKAVEELQRFAQEATGDEKAAAMLAIASEEIIANAIYYGHSRKASVDYIDVNVSRNGDRLVIRIRDDGVAFDPTSVSGEEDGEFRYGGIDVVRRVASDFKYLRVLNTNNTIMEVQINTQEANAS